MRLLPLAILLPILGCEATTPSQAPQQIAITRSLGTWQGRGSQTIGIVSESGHLRVSWQTRDERPRGTGTFRLALHSAVSGRPIQLIAEHRGEGRGSTDVADDPRQYNLMVDSENVEWTFHVEEIVARPDPDPPSS